MKPLELMAMALGETFLQEVGYHYEFPQKSVEKYPFFFYGINKTLIRQLKLLKV